MEPGLAVFEDAHAQAIVDWVGSPQELEAWASRADLDLSVSLLREWHKDPDVHPYGGAGFTPATSAQSERFNREQPHDYVWMRLESLGEGDD